MTGADVTSTRSRAVVLGVAAAAAVVDWVTKAMAVVVLDDGTIDIGSVIMLRLSHNPGIAFGLGDRLPGGAIIAMTAAVTLGIGVASLRGYFPSRVAPGLLLGGAVANLGDRIIGGSVVDFLDLGWWPSFNLADAFLCVGAGLLLLQSLRLPTDETVPS